LAEPQLNKRILSCPVALFVGAGASVPLGLPDTKSFVPKLDERLRDSGLREWLTVGIGQIGQVDAEILLGFN